MGSRNSKFNPGEEKYGRQDEKDGSGTDKEEENEVRVVEKAMVIVFVLFLISILFYLSF
jgi:hypothetical protein